ncbi:hypothetical protein NQ315_015269 [Exocentrus adspersus]|uniref:C2H2-type domain-containing protein n=1 Tax=Exocentrus adspersus TaxID=1586481 RepID=A0AAV8VAI6_9CUCU|nr:hypothetical protein NQ315_015269 [Exocentrus adspersus]
MKESGCTSELVKVELDAMKIEHYELIADKNIKREDYECFKTAAEIEASKLISNVVKIEQDDFASATIKTEKDELVDDTVKIEENTTSTDKQCDVTPKIEFIDCCKWENLQEGANAPEQFKSETHETNIIGDNRYITPLENNSHLNLFVSSKFNQQVSPTLRAVTPELEQHKSESEIQKVGLPASTSVDKTHSEVTRKHDTLTNSSIQKDQLLQTKSFKCDMCDFSVKRKHHLKRHMLIHKDPSEIEWFRCYLCNFQAKRKYDLRSHMLVHIDTSRMECFKCDLCNYEGKRKSDLGHHMLVHKDPAGIQWFKCDLCDFKSKRKLNLAMHVERIHKNLSQAGLSTCELCGFRTKYFKSHMLLHKDEPLVLKCDFCGFLTKDGGVLNSHMLGHKHPSQVEVQGTIHIDDMMKVELKSVKLEPHESISEKKSEDGDFDNTTTVEMKSSELISNAVKIEQGELVDRTVKIENNELINHDDCCHLEDPRQGDLNSTKQFKCELHSWRNRSTSDSPECVENFVLSTKPEVVLIKSELEQHEDITDAQKVDLSTGTWIDESPSQVTQESNTNKPQRKTDFSTRKSQLQVEWFKCDICGLKVKRKHYLKRHMLIHKNPSEIEWFRCDSCDFETKLKRSLKNHMLVHKEPSQIEWFQCDACNYKTQWKTNLRIHIERVHKKSSQTLLMKCELCNFRTKYLKSHMLLHTDEAQTFKCDLCNFKTKDEDILNRHVMFVHKDRTEGGLFRCDLCRFKAKCKLDMKFHINSDHKIPLG